MHQYKITAYAQDGTEAVSRYADSPVEAIRIYGELFGARDEEGGKRYRTVTLSVGTYKKVDYQAFVSMFSA